MNKRPTLGQRQKIKKHIRRSYTKEDQSICLYEGKENWIDVLRSQDVNWNNIRTINLGKCGITDRTVKNISSLQMQSLRTLYLQFNTIKANGVNTLFRGQKWPSLSSVILSHNNIQAEGLEVIAEVLSRNLQSLSLQDCKIPGVGLRCLPNFKFTNLTDLILSDNQIGNLGVKILTKVDMPCLQKLYIEQCQIGNQGVRHLIKGKWKDLQHLLLNNNYITFSGYQRVVEMESKQVKLLLAQITDAVIYENVIPLQACYINIPIVIQNRKFCQCFYPIFQEKFLIQNF